MGALLNERCRCHRSTDRNSLLRTCQGSSELLEARHRDGAAMLGLQGAEVLEGVDPLPEVGGNLTKANLQGLDHRLAGLHQ